MLHTVPKCTKFTVCLISSGVYTVKTFEITILRLFDIDGKWMCKRNNFR